MYKNNTVYLDSGTVSFYKNQTVNTAGAVSPSEVSALYSTENFGELTVGASRFYSAQSASIKIDRMIRIWRDRNITDAFTAVIDGEKYYVRQVQHAEDSNGLPVSDISLERTERG